MARTRALLLLLAASACLLIPRIAAIGVQLDALTASVVSGAAAEGEQPATEPLLQAEDAAEGLAQSSTGSRKLLQQSTSYLILAGGTAKDAVYVACPNYTRPGSSACIGTSKALAMKFKAYSTVRNKTTYYAFAPANRTSKCLTLYSSAQNKDQVGLYVDTCYVQNTTSNATALPLPWYQLWNYWSLPKGKNAFLASSSWVLYGTGLGKQIRARGKLACDPDKDSSCSISFVKVPSK